MSSSDNKCETKVQASEKKTDTDDVAMTSPKSSPTKKEIDIKTKALNLYTQGKRHLLVQDISSAVNSLQEACQLLAEEYGDLAVECAEPYFYYGKALLELARIENGVLGNALDGVPEGEDLENSQVEDPGTLTDGQKAEVSDKVGEAIEENFKQLELNGTGKDKNNKTENDKMEESDSCEDVSDNTVNVDYKEKEENNKETTSNESEESEEDKSQDDEIIEDKSQETAEGDVSQVEAEEEGDETDEDEEVSNLQLAWEILELAKVIYGKQLEENDSISLKLAQVHLKLGEVSMENENYPQSIEDITECIKIQKEKLKPDDRCLAESHYQLGVAHSFSDDFDKSSECFAHAAKVIEDRKTNLIKIKAEKEGWSVDQRKKYAETCEDPLYSEQGEIEELEKLLPDIKEKILDMEEMKKDSKEKFAKVKEAAFASLLGGSNGASTSTANNAFSSSIIEGPAKPVSNISHLVKKKVNDKRKPEEEMNGHLAKKTKLDLTPLNGVSHNKETEKMDDGE